MNVYSADTFAITDADSTEIIPDTRSARPNICEERMDLPMKTN